MSSLSVPGFAEYRGDNRAVPPPTSAGPAIHHGNTFCNNPLGRGRSAGHARDGNRRGPSWLPVMRVAGINFVLFKGSAA